MSSPEQRISWAPDASPSRPRPRTTPADLLRSMASRQACVLQLPGELFADLHDGPMLVALRKADLPGHVFEFLPVRGADGPVVEGLPVVIEIDPPLAADLDGRGSLHPVAAERLCDVLPWALRRIGECQPQALHQRVLPLVLEDHDPALAIACQR